MLSRHKITPKSISLIKLKLNLLRDRIKLLQMSNFVKKCLFYLKNIFILHNKMRAGIIILFMSIQNHPKQFIQDVNIKSKYLNNDQPRKIIISPHVSQISISQSGKPSNFKDFHIDQLQSHQVNGNTVTLNFDNGRKYLISSQKPQHIDKALMHTKYMKLCNSFVEQNINVVPKNIDYTQMANRMSINSQQQHLLNLKIEKLLPGMSSIQGRKEKVTRQYKKLSHFIKPTDWRLKEQEGELVLMNEEWQGNTTKIFAFVLKKFFTTGTFMGISFPVFAMRTQSILQTYAKSLASAPNIINNTRDHLERIKQFMSLLWSFSLLQVTIVKPFNPVIGQTFQADICGGRFSAEQVCHHPPISAFFFEKDNYKIHASLEMSASIGVNSGEGRFIGDITIEYDDKYWIKARLPNGKITGVLIGETTFQTYGGAYAYDSKNVVLTYKLNDNYLFEGHLGLLNYQTSKKFQQILKDKDRFSAFTAYSKEQYSKIFSHFTAKYAQWVAFDGKIYNDLRDPKLLPYALEPPLDKFHLKSDSSFRKDIQLLKINDLDRSQEQKERIQNQERHFRKLREQHKQ